MTIHHTVKHREFLVEVMMMEPHTTLMLREGRWSMVKSLVKMRCTMSLTRMG